MIKTNLEQNAAIINEYENRLFDSAVDFVNECIAHDFESSDYICDAISEFADNNTSIYYCDIMEFIAHNPDALSDAAAEFGVDSRNFDIYKLGQQAEFMQIENNIYSDFDEMIEYAALIYADSINLDLSNSEILESVKNSVCVINSNSRIWDIVENVKSDLEIGEI